MQALYLLFMRQVIKNVALLCLVSVAGLIAVQQFLFNQAVLSSYIALAIFWLGVALYQANHSVPKNLNWILGLPLGRQRLLVLTLVVNVSILVICTVCYFAAVGMADLLRGGHLRNVNPILQTVGSFIRYFQHKLFVTPSAFAWANACLIGMTSLTALSAPSWRLSNRPLNLRTLLQCLWSSTDKQNAQYRRTVFAVCLGFAFLAKDYLVSPFGVFTLVLIGIALIFPRVWRQGICLSRTEMNFATLILGLIASCEIAWVYGLERHELVSASTDVRVRAIEFLGPFSGPISQQAFAHILESSLSKESLVELSRVYMEKFHHGKKIVASQDPYLHFEAAVASKDSVSSLVKTVEIFQPASLNARDLKALFSAMVPLTGDPREMRLFLMMLEASVEPDELKRMLESNNEAEIRYGLVRARYDRDASLVAHIEKNMPHFSDEEIIIALHTLSILGGERVKLEDWRNFKNGRKLASSFFDANCDNFQPESLESIPPRQFARLNICLRLKADRKDLFLLEDIEEAGWISPPVNSYQRTILTEVFGLE